MAKLRRDPIDANFIDNFLVNEDDFNFELSCLQLLKKQDVVIEHGGTYADPVTNLPPQFDFRVSVPIFGSGISLAIECKNLKPFFPLVVSRVPRSEREAFHEVLFPPERAGAGMFAISVSHFCRGFRYSGEKSIYEIGAPVGKSTVQLGVKEGPANEIMANDAEVHEKWSQAVASAYGLVNDAAHTFAFEDGCNSTAHFIAPVLVVPDGALWVADYDLDGKRSGVARQEDEVEFCLDHSPWRVGQSFSYTFSHLHFVTQSGLESFISRMRSRNQQNKLFGADAADQS
jgi:hypothetical protein